MALLWSSISDEEYVLDLCDEVLGHTAIRQHRFDFLRGDGDPGARLPVDAWYPDLGLAIEYREIQDEERLEDRDDRRTATGIRLGEQHALYDQRRRDVLPAHGIALVEVSYAELGHSAAKRLKRNRCADLAVLRERLQMWLAGV